MTTAFEQLLTSACKDEMISFMAAHPEHFAEAVALAVSDRQPFAWRAAWLLSGCMRDNDERIRRHLKTILDAIPGRGDGHQRELLKVLSRMKLGERHESRLFDVCLSIWERPSASPSVRITAFRHIVALAKKYPELANEIVGLTQEWHLETLSPGVRRSISRLLNDPALRGSSR